MPICGSSKSKNYSSKRKKDTIIQDLIEKTRFKEEDIINMRNKF